MIWLDMTEEHGNGLYLDVRGIEARRAREETVFSISGVLGDGSEEAEIFMEIGRETEVLFVDDWLGKTSKGGLLSRLNREGLAAALKRSTSELFFCIENFPAIESKPRQQVRGYRCNGRWLPVRPAPYGDQMELPLAVSSPAEGWRMNA